MWNATMEVLFDIIIVVLLILLAIGVFLLCVFMMLYGGVFGALGVISIGYIFITLIDRI